MTLRPNEYKRSVEALHEKVKLASGTFTVDVELVPEEETFPHDKRHVGIVMTVGQPGKRTGLPSADGYIIGYVRKAKRHVCADVATSDDEKLDFGWSHADLGTDEYCFTSAWPYNVMEWLHGNRNTKLEKKAMAFLVVAIGEGGRFPEVRDALAPVLADPTGQLTYCPGLTHRDLFRSLRDQPKHTKARADL